MEKMQMWFKEFFSPKLESNLPSWYLATLKYLDMCFLQTRPHPAQLGRSHSKPDTPAMQAADPIQLLPQSQWCPWLWRVQLRAGLVFSCSSSSLASSSAFPKLAGPWHGGGHRPVSVQMPLIWGLVCRHLMVRFRLGISGEYPRNGTFSSCVSSQMHVILICLISDDFDLLVKWCLTGFSAVVRIFFFWK